MRTGGRGQPRKLPRLKRMGSTTCIVGTYELARGPSAIEQKHIDRATADLNKRHRRAEDEYDWIRWTKHNKFADECREGDTIAYQSTPHAKKDVDA